MTENQHFAFLTLSGSSVSHEVWLVHTTDNLWHWVMLPDVLARSNAVITTEQPRSSKPVPGSIMLSPGHLVLPRALLSPHGTTCPMVHPVPSAGESGSGMLPNPLSLSSEIRHTAQRFFNKCGSYKCSKAFQPQGAPASMHKAE